MAPTKDVFRTERESAIATAKSKLVLNLADLIVLDSDRDDFLALCKRIEANIRAWYTAQFEDLMQLHSVFEPCYGPHRLMQQEISPAKVDVLEQRFLEILFQLLEKSNFKIITDEEIELAAAGQYLLNLPIVVDTTRLDTKLLAKYFSEHPHDHLPIFSNQYVLFRRGLGIDQTTDYFVLSKLDVILSRTWGWILRLLRLKHKGKADGAGESLMEVKDSQQHSGKHGHLYVERTRIQNMQISFRNLFKKNTVQEPTFERVILLYRQATPRNCKSDLGDRAIHVKHFRNIPLADLELVFPEKKNPSLTPMDWLKFLISAIVGLVAFLGSLEMNGLDIRVALAILGGFVGYCLKINMTFQSKLREYQNLITRSMYDKQLDSGKGTLLHLCDDVIQQEVKEVIVAYFVLMTQGKATVRDLDLRCEQLMLEEFSEKCDFEVEDAVQKMDKLGIVTRDSLDRYTHQSLRRSNQVLGVTKDGIALPPPGTQKL
eukprot:TRINITY_DN14419_c0_g1_i1.p1 TRINITY_DN14419_c0_g1~~TRINITY_DN14419_c0_g1_i1.p1  ORF type:complete len:487 (+),score=87.98 TRINITY_DN14419_c0_g1_i1:55-1515(+)